jgi:hypothetical protein
MICEACHLWIPEHEVGGRMVRTRPHEIRTRGAGGKCTEENQLVLCLRCHQLIHSIGPIEFQKKHPFLAKKIEKALNLA